MQEPDVSLRDVKKYLMELIEENVDISEFTIGFDRVMLGRHKTASVPELKALGYMSEDGESWTKDIRLSINSFVVNIVSRIR